MLFITGSILLYPFLKVAVAKPAVLAPKMTDDKAVTVLNSLLKNIYRSFDFREEEDVYDRLATSVSGDLLSEIYLQNRKSMVVTQAGGARARVKEVEILDVDVNNLMTALWGSCSTRNGPPWDRSVTGATSTSAKINTKPTSA